MRVDRGLLDRPLQGSRPDRDGFAGPGSVAAFDEGISMVVCLNNPRPNSEGRRWLRAAEVFPVKPLDPSGKRLCRVCGTVVPRRRRSLCSTGCHERLCLTISRTAQRRAVWRRDRGICHHCGRDTAAHGENWEMHHEPSLAAGGGVRPGMSTAEILDGLVTLCQACHRSVTQAERYAAYFKRMEAAEELVEDLRG